ncbi:MAG: SDR family oxidoreductase, partial [Acidobacteriota bacterium]|nr:SDR family oxidoreductase [Acidobacteriota bacterium]
MLRDRQIVLAGGSGGLGSATAELLDAEGARLIVSYRSNAERARRWNGIQADLTVSEDRHRLLDNAPQIYALVIFTGDPARLSPGASLEKVLRRSHEINFLGPILLAREAAERMKAAARPGAIVLISSMQSSVIVPNSTAYAASKAALEHAAKILAKQCRGPANIRVNVVSPGVIDAGMAQAS